MRFDFAFDYPLAAPLAPFGILPSTSYVDVAAGQLVARFGPWTLRTPLSNIASTDVTGPYRWYTAIGVRLSMADRGITFGSTSQQGLCIQFHEPVKALIPGGHGPGHPGATLTVADPLGLQREIIRASA